MVSSSTFEHRFGSRMWRNAWRRKSGVIRHEKAKISDSSSRTDAYHGLWQAVSGNNKANVKACVKANRTSGIAPRALRHNAARLRNSTPCAAWQKTINVRCAAQLALVRSRVAAYRAAGWQRSTQRRCITLFVARFAALVRRALLRLLYHYAGACASLSLMFACLSAGIDDRGGIALERVNNHIFLVARRQAVSRRGGMYWLGGALRASVAGGGKKRKRWQRQPGSNNIATVAASLLKLAGGDVLS